MLVHGLPTLSLTATDKNRPKKLSDFILRAETIGVSVDHYIEISISGVFDTQRWEKGGLKAEGWVDSRTWRAVVGSSARPKPNPHIAANHHDTKYNEVSIFPQLSIPRAPDLVLPPGNRPLISIKLVSFGWLSKLFRVQSNSIIWLISHMWFWLLGHQSLYDDRMYRSRIYQNSRRMFKLLVISIRIYPKNSELVSWPWTLFYRSNRPTFSSIFVYFPRIFSTQERKKWKKPDVQSVWKVRGRKANPFP